MHDHIKTSSLLGLSFYPNSPCVLGMNTTTIILPLEWGRNTCFQISLSSNTRLCHATSTTPSLTSIVKRINCCNCITSWTSQKVTLHLKALCSPQQIIVITTRAFTSQCTSLLIGSSHEGIKCLRQRLCLKYSFIPRKDPLTDQ